VTQQSAPACRGANVPDIEISGRSKQLVGDPRPR